MPTLVEWVRKVNHWELVWVCCIDFFYIVCSFIWPLFI